MGRHHAKHHAAKQKKHQVEEASATLYRAVGCDVNGPLNRQPVLVNAVNVNMIALHASIGNINRHMSAELMEFDACAVIGGDVG